MAQFEVTIPVGETLLVPKPVAWHRDEDGNVLAVETVGVVAHTGDIIDEEDIAPAVLQAIADGDERMCSLYSPVGAPAKAPAKKAAAKESKESDEDAKMRRENAIADQIKRNPLAGEKE